VDRFDWNNGDPALATSGFRVTLSRFLAAGTLIQLCHKLRGRVISWVIFGRELNDGHAEYLGH
jgi:hypothetical protein